MTDNRGEDAKIEAGKEAQALLASASFASIATIDVATGAPYVSLVAVGASRGLPVLLLSGLARHTRNIQSDSRASLLLSAASTEHPGDQRDPLAKARVTLIGKMVNSNAEEDRTAFLTRHQSAAGYATFSDFAFYRLEIDAAHFIGGFGRIIELTARHLLAAGPAGA